MLPLVELSQAEHRSDRERGARRGEQYSGHLPLAPLQEGILFHHLLAERRRSVFVGQPDGVSTSRGRLDRYLAALQAVIDRHDILRTAVVWEGLSEPVQVVWRKAALIGRGSAAGCGDGMLAEQLRRGSIRGDHRLDCAPGAADASC